MNVTRRQIFTLSFLAVFLLSLGQLLVLIRPFFSPILWAVILATATYPLYLRLRQAMGNRSNLASFVMTSAVLVAVVLPAVYGIVLAGQEGIEAYEQAASWMDAGHLHEVGEVLGRLPGVGQISQELVGRAIVAASESIQASLLQGGKAVSTFVLSQSVDLAANALMLMTDFLVMLFTLFFLFRDGERGYATLLRALPLEEEHKVKIVERLRVTLNAVVRGTLLTALAQGCVAGVTYALLGLPFAVFWGVLSCLLSFLPIGGTALVWGPLALYLLFTGAVGKAVVLVAVGVLLVGLLDNLLQPILVGSGAHLPVLPLFFASLGGLAAYGFLGLFLGPVLLAMVLESFAIYQEDYQQPKSELVLASDVSAPLAGDPGDMPSKAPISVA